MVNLVMISLMLSAVRRFLVTAFPKQAVTAEEILYISVCMFSYIAVRMLSSMRFYTGYIIYLAWTFVEFTADIVSESKTEKAMFANSVREAGMLHKSKALEL